MIPGILADLKRDEGFRASVYQDHLGFWTIGYGFLVDARKGAGIPPNIAEAWLDFLVRAKEAELDARIPWWKTQPDDIRRALLNMSYQLGTNGLLNFRRMLAALEAGDRAAAAREAMDSTWAKQTPQRAMRVMRLIRGSEG